MRQLGIIRHAKSSWDDPSLDDFDRPLKKRGLRDAPEMGRRLRQRDTRPDLMVTSPALRALTTARHIADALGFGPDNIRRLDAIYEASSNRLFDVLRELPAEANTVLLFGHNPGLTDFANDLTGEEIDNIPTCGVVWCRLAIENWRDLTEGSGEMLWLDYPKKDNS